MLIWLSSIAHWIILHVASALFITFFIGWSVITKIGFAWKYGRSLREVIIKVNAIFSMCGYLAFAPWKT